jgi:dihydrofolate reductase
MGKIVISQFISADGVIEDPGGAEKYAHGGWTFKFSSDEQMAFKLQEVKAADALLLGRITYQGFAAAWPGMSDPVGFADKMNSMPKYVVTSTLTELIWNNTTRIDADVVARIRELKETEGGEILVNGSATLCQTLIENDLVDEYRLMTFPTVLGSGKRLFGSSDWAIDLALVGLEQYPSGVYTVTYNSVH